MHLIHFTPHNLFNRKGDFKLATTQ